MSRLYSLFNAIVTYGWWGKEAEYQQQCAWQIIHWCSKLFDNKKHHDCCKVIFDYFRITIPIASEKKWILPRDCARSRQPFWIRSSGQQMFVINHIRRRICLNCSHHSNAHILAQVVCKHSDHRVGMMYGTDTWKTDSFTHWGRVTHIYASVN